MMKPDERPVANSGSASTDTARLQWLAGRCYLPKDHPDDGILVVVAERFAPLGVFTCDGENDLNALRMAIDRAMAQEGCLPD